MERFKKIMRKILFPKVWVILVTSAIGFPLMIISLIFLSNTNPISYITYVLSAYALTVICVNFPRAKRRCKQLLHGDEIGIIRLMRKYKYTNMYLESREFRAKISLYAGFAINCFYAVFKCVTGGIFHSAWLWAIGIYYIMLGSIRFMLLKNIRITDKKERSDRRKIEEFKIYRKCGIMMFFMNLAMTGMVFQMIWRNRSYDYKGYIIYISALYTFYSFISAIANVVQFRKSGRPILSAAKNLNLAGAAMSMFTLQTAMFSAFDQNGQSNQQLMNTVTGTAVCIIVIGIAVFMIIRANKNINALMRGDLYGK
jgi:hypothetical protein